jgi:hypothetical protein
VSDTELAKQIYRELSHSISAIQALDYEIRSSWFIDRFAGRLPKWVMALASRYFAIKSKRRYRRYQHSCHWKKELRRYKEEVQR